MKTIRDVIGYEGDAWERLILAEVIRRHPRPVSPEEVAETLKTYPDVVITFAKGMRKEQNGREPVLQVDAHGLRLLSGSEWIGALGHPGADITAELEEARVALKKAGIVLSGEPEPAPTESADVPEVPEIPPPVKGKASKKKTTRKKGI